MKKFKLAMAVGLTLLTGLVLTACGSGEKAASKSEDGKVKIEYWYGLGSEADKKMKELISGFNDSQTKYEVVAVPQADYTETYQKLQAAMASKTAPGLVILQNGNLNDLGKKGVLTDLTAYTEADKNYDEKDFLPVFMDQAKVDNKIVALPAYATTQVMYYRKDLFEKAGIDSKEAFSSWENLMAASKKLKDSGTVEAGFSPMWGADNLTDIALSNGGTILNKAGDKVEINSKEWVDAWEMIRKGIHEDKTLSIQSGGQGWEYWYKTIDDVMGGTSAGYIGSSGDKGNLDFSIIDSAPQPGMNGHQGKPSAGALYLAVPESIKDEEKDAAYAFISYFTTADTQASWSKAIGYIPVRNSTLENTEYAKFIEENPYNGVPFQQAQNATPAFIDPTGGKITDALKIAADKVELENISAKEALDEAQKTAQKALDEK